MVVQVGRAIQHLRLPPELQTVYRVTGAIADYLIREPTLQVAYVRAHVGENIPHTIVESPAFVTYDMGFELQAFAGEPESWTDGYFWPLGNAR